MKNFKVKFLENLFKISCKNKYFLITIFLKDFQKQI